jgi:hypothetical protein
MMLFTFKLFTEVTQLLPDCDLCDGGQNLSPFRRACEHVDVGTCPHQVFAATLTLFQPGVGRLCPPYTVVPTKF